MKILLKIPLSKYSGYGADGCGMALALKRAGHDVYLHPTEVQAPLDKEITDLLTKPLEAPFDLTIVHLDPSRLEVDELERRTTKKLVAWTMWEWESFDNLKGRSKLRKQLKEYDAVLAYDEITAKCFEPYYKGPIFTLQGGYDQKEITYTERDWETEPFRFFMLGVLSQRKNPYAAIRAFTELCSEDENFNQNARLILKTISPPGFFVRMEEVYPNLRILYGSWSRETLIDFLGHMHVLLAPSWGEGKNLPALEFMTSGGAVLATDWGGMSYWLNEDYAYPLNYELDYMNAYENKVRSAKVSHDHLKETMRHVFYNREEAKLKGRKASEIVPKRYSWDNVVRQLIHNIVPQIPIKEIYNGKAS